MCAGQAPAVKVHLYPLSPAGFIDTLEWYAVVRRVSDQVSVFRTRALPDYTQALGYAKAWCEWVGMHLTDAIFHEELEPSMVEGV